MMPHSMTRKSRIPSRKNTTQVAVPDGYIATAEAARRLGIVHSTLLYRIGRGQIKTETIMIPALVVPEMEIQNLLDEQELLDDGAE